MGDIDVNDWTNRVVIRPHRLHAVHGCRLLLQMSQVAWSVCLSVCLRACWAHGWAVQNQNEWTDRNAILGGGNSCGSKEPFIRWGPDLPMGRGTFEGDMCRPTVTHGEAGDECIRPREGWQIGDAASCKILKFYLKHLFGVRVSSEHCYWRISLHVCLRARWAIYWGALPLMSVVALLWFSCDLPTVLWRRRYENVKNLRA